MTSSDPALSQAPLQADGISVARWFGFYAILLAAALVPLWMLLQQHGASWHQWRHDFKATFAATPADIKLLVMLIYLSLCTTLLPLPTGWLITAMATQEAAIASELWSTTLIVATVGAIGSTIANLNDYHLFTWMLRSRRLGHVRDTRTFQASEKWFQRAPFFILTLFNLIPIPVDVIRLLAIGCRYPRLKFAAANFIGRFGRYAVFAFVTYWFKLGWVAPVSLLALATVLALGKLLLPKRKEQRA